MRMRGWLFVFVLVAGAAGVWLGAATAGTAATPWIKVAIGALMILFGGVMVLSRDAVGKGYTWLFGCGYILLGLSQLAPSGSWSLGVSLLGLGCVVAALVRQRRSFALARRP